MTAMSERLYARAAIKAICRRALELGKILPERQVIADEVGVPVKAVWRAFSSLRERGEVVTRGPVVMAVTE